MSTIELPQELKADALATEIGIMFDKFKDTRAAWENETLEIRNAVFASTIDTTTNASNPFSNRTTIPKLTQIYDNLIANYDASLFPNMDWFTFISEDQKAATTQSRRIVKSYMRTKLRQLKFRAWARTILADWILYGNCYAGLEFVREYAQDPITGEKLLTYVGPKPYRISPYDIVFNVSSTDFKSAAKIIRTVKSLGTILKEAETHPESGYTKEVVANLLKRRSTVLNASTAIHDVLKNLALTADGFSSLQSYYASSEIEILELYGDIFIQSTQELMTNRHITVIDRCDIVLNEPMRSWNGSQYKYHCGWRNRPDSIIGMSPLANLVGMQHRVDKNENTKADVFDQIAYPVIHEKGDCEFFDGQGVMNGVRGGPGGLYRSDQDGDVSYIRPDATALNADTMTQTYMGWMEDLAGAPKNTMGIRTPGEKTAFEVQTLDNAASRIFQNKIAYFEEEFLEPLLNDMLEMSRRELTEQDMIKLVGDQLGEETFVSITKEDLAISGKIAAVGSRYFARDAAIAQNLTTLSGSPMYADLKPDLDRHKLATLMEDLMGLDRFGLFRSNVGVEQELETQLMMEQAKQTLATNAQTPSEGPMPPGAPVGVPNNATTKTSPSTEPRR